MHWQYLVKSDIWFPAPAYDVDEPELPSPYCAELQGESLLTNVSLAYLDVLVSLPPSPFEVSGGGQVANSPWYRFENKEAVEKWCEIQNDTSVSFSS